MEQHTLRRITTASVATVIGLAAGANAAFACNLGTQDGVNSSDCSTRWSAESMHSDDAGQYPESLTKNLDGTVAHGGASGGNWGYITDVSPDRGNQGIFEINHFHPGNYSTFAWRLPVATVDPLQNVVVKLTLPQGMTKDQVSFDAQSTSAMMTRWGGNYADYTWSGGKARVTDYDAATNTYTIAIDSLEAKSGTVFQFSVSGLPNQPIGEAVKASATMSATNTNSASCAPKSAMPTVTQKCVPGPDNDTLSFSGIEVKWGKLDFANGKLHTVGTLDKVYNLKQSDGSYVATDSVTLDATDVGDCTKTTTTQIPVVTKVPVYKTVTSNPLVGDFQVDRQLPYHKKGTWANGRLYKVNTPLTAAENALAVAEDNDNLLRYRESGTKLFGTQDVKIVRVYLSDVKAAGSLQKAIEKKSGWKISPNVTSFPAGGYAKAWKMPTGWTKGHEFGPKNNQPQVDFDVVKLPTATTTKVQTGWKTVTTYETKTTTVDVPQVSPKISVNR